MDLKSQATFENKFFQDTSCKEETITNKVFDHCQFKKVRFDNSHFKQCHWIDCEIEACNLSMVAFEQCRFDDVIFSDSKLIGVDWTRVKWPSIRLASPLKFYQSDLSCCNFFALMFPEILMEACKLHGVDFREATLSEASFVGSDFKDSLLMHTDLSGADFTDAINYFINPFDNTIRGAKFSMPDAMNLLNGFEIEIDGV